MISSQIILQDKFTSTPLPPPPIFCPQFFSLSIHKSHIKFIKASPTNVRGNSKQTQHISVALILDISCDTILTPRQFVRILRHSLPSPAGAESCRGPLSSGLRHLAPSLRAAARSAPPLQLICSRRVDCFLRTYPGRSGPRGICQSAGPCFSAVRGDPRAPHTTHGSFWRARHN